MRMAARWAVVTLGALAPGVALWQVAAATETTIERGEVTLAAPVPRSGPQLVTPVLSARRVPGLLLGQSATSKVVPALQSFAAKVPATGCFVARTNGQVLVERSGTATVIPASTAKIVTAAVALEVLGADHRFRTTVRGTPTGDTAAELFLVGGGDPNLTSPAYPAAGALDADGIRKAPDHPTSLAALADQVRDAGIRRVGRLVGDESAFDSDRTVAAWGRTYSADTVGPLSALLVDDGLRTFRPAALTTNPPLHAAGRLAELLRARGVTVDTTATGVAPAAAKVVAAVESAPLTELLADLLTWSDNTSAELLLKAMGNGTTAGGLAVVRDRLAAWGISGVALADGSGLARSNVATCTGLVQVLTRLGATSPVVQGLAVAGRTGTLAGAPFAGTAADGVLRAKTGTLTEVKALAGVYLPAGVAPIDVALVVLGPAAATTEAQLWPGLAAALGTYPFRPDLSPFLPLPPA